MAAQLPEHPRSCSTKSGKRVLALSESFECQHCTANHFIVLWRKVHRLDDVLLCRVRGQSLFETARPPAGVCLAYNRTLRTIDRAGNSWDRELLLRGSSQWPSQA